ncbi:MAG: NnrS family protein [Verrucomicrobia bacterium]|nr:NnrS family protein [Verrucomicrobiota bacterium]MDA1067286.1 NnrS family protein [Verrucomicrobiota bacterium]
MFRLLREEPFRIFFPAGILASIVAVALWPLVYGGWLDYYPGEAHARMMIQGFVGGFALGFLGTAFPKMIESPSLTSAELGVLLLAYLGCVFAHAFDQIALGDIFFLLCWFTMMTALVVRFVFFRKDLPPPGFTLAGLGLLAGVAGTLILLLGRFYVLSEFQFKLGALFLNEAFILGPIVGIGGFLFPRFFSDEAVKESALSWNARACFGFIIGLLLFGTYITQAAGVSTLAPMIRSLIVTLYLHSQVSVFQRGSSTGSLSLMLRMAVAFLLLGIFVSGVTDVFQVAMKHVIFISGYGMLILAIATRVTWGHSGNLHLTLGKRTSLRIILGIVLLAMTTRIVADLIPAIRVSHHVYAAISWLIATVVWSWAVLRYVRQMDAEEE